MLGNSWFKKEKPLLGLTGMGGGAGGYLVGGATGIIAAGSSQDNAVERVWDLILGGQTLNGYYWLKGSGSTQDARQFYCILDSNWMALNNTPIGNEYGWAIIANHDADKFSHQGHQPRPTAQSGYAGSDGGSVDTVTNQVPEYSYSQHCESIPFEIMMHWCYDNSSMSSWNANNGTTSPLAYYYCGWNSDQTIPTSNAWSKARDWGPNSYYLKMNGSNHARRLAQQTADYDIEGMGCWNSSAGPNPRIIGSGASLTYPLYAGVWGYVTSGAGPTFSFHDKSPVAASQSAGWDDFQDGSGMGDAWEVEGVGANAYRGYPSAIAIH